MWIDINKISISYSFAVLCGLVTIFLKADFSILYLTAACIIFLANFIIWYRYFKNNQMLLLAYGIFFIIFLSIYIFTDSYVKNTISNIIFACGYIFLIYTLYALVSYSNLAKILVKEKSQYIIHSSFRYAFFPAVFFIIIYGFLLYLLALPVKKLGVTAVLILFSFFSLVIYIFMMLKLFKYKYAFKLLCLLNNQAVDFNSLTLSPIVNYDFFFQKNIKPYITNIYIYGNSIAPVGVDLKKKEPEAKKIENNESVLLESIKQLDDIVKLAEKNNIAIYDSLSSIKSTLMQIDDVSKDNIMLNSYISDIQTKYIPYLQKVTEIYIDNLDLPAPLITDIQIKIESSVKSIKTAFDEILKSMFDMKKIDIESSIDVMNIQLLQDGLIKTYKKGR